MRDMEELQKSHVLKVEDFSRRKLTEDFEAATPFFQGSNVKTVYNFGDNDAKYPDAEVDDVHTTTVSSGATSKCELVAGFLLTKKACFKVHSLFFSKYRETRYRMSEKAQI